MKNNLSLDNVTRIKGILCVAVLLHHVNQCLSCFDNTVLDLFFNQLGYLSVAVFFFFSGYGLTSQVQKKKDYVKKIWLSKIIPLYLIYLIVCLIYTIAVLVLKKSLPIQTMISTPFFGGTIVRNGWYFQSLFVLYLIFYISFRFLNKDEHRILSIALLTVGYVILCCLLKLDPMWYQSAFVFLMGVIWRFYEEKIVKYISWWMALIACALFGMFFMAAKLIDVPFVAIIMKGISAHCFVLVILSAMYLFPFINKMKVSKILGKYSLEIYAFHGLALMLFRSNWISIENDYLFAVVVICTTLVVAIAISPVFTFISKRFKKLADKVYNEKEKS